MSEALKSAGNKFDVALGSFVLVGVVAYFLASNARVLWVAVAIMLVVASINLVVAITTGSDIQLITANAFASTALAIESVIRAFAVVWPNEAVMTSWPLPLYGVAMFVVGITMYAAAATKRDGADEIFVSRFFALLPIVGTVFRRAVMPFLPVKRQSA